MTHQENTNLTFIPNTDVLGAQVNSGDTSVTAEVFEDFIECFDCANKKYFGSALSQPVMSFTRHPKVKCCFLPNRYQNLDGATVHGYCFNSAYAQAMGDKNTLAMIGFIMAQHWRCDFGPLSAKGKRSTPGYVDRALCHKLIEIGLNPTDGTDSGRCTGYGLMAEITDNGPFDLMCRALLISGFRIRWHELPAKNTATENGDASQNGTSEKPQKQTRAKFACADCGLAAWSKPSAVILCGCNSLPLNCQS